jgi:hypothetical protein
MPAYEGKHAQNHKWNAASAYPSKAQRLRAHISLKVCSIDPETLGNILRINSPDTGRKRRREALPGVWPNLGFSRSGTTSFGRKISHTPPKTVVRVSMLRASEPPYSTYKRRRRTPHLTHNKKGREELNSKAKPYLRSA